MEDVAAMQRFWAPERLLATLQDEQQRRLQEQGDAADASAREFQHIGARLNGRAVEGGPGRMRVARPGDAASGGVLWVQPTSPASCEAQEARRASLATDKRSPAALFVPLADVVRASASASQDSAPGVDLTLVSGHSLHFSFLPGPLFRASHRDEFLAIVIHRLASLRQAAGAGDGRRDAGAALATAGGGEESSRVSGGEDERATSAGATAEQDRARREAMRELVRKYLLLNESSDEAIRLARQVHESTGYHLGPMAKRFPRFADDTTHRKKTVQQLSRFLTAMNEEWTRADAQRELHTSSRAFRNQDELFQYTDAVTGEDLSPRSYEARYAQYARLSASDPVIRRFSSAEGASEGGAVTAEGSPMAQLSALLGVDVSTSCVIDEAFFARDGTGGESQQDAGADVTCLSDGEAARRLLWNRWEAAFSSYVKQRSAAAGSAGEALNAAGTRDDGAARSSSPGARKRPRDARRRIVSPGEGAETAEAQGESPTLPEGSGADREAGRSPGKRQRRSPSSSMQLRSEDDRKPARRRKARRQSITGAIDASLLAASDGEAARDGAECAGGDGQSVVTA